ncbi:retrovirus-related pol polyprotein from transposon TNT 1-94 [Tanacetum coccineum]
MHLRWSPIGKMFDIKGKIIASSESNGDNACTPNPQEPKIKRFPNSTSFLGRNLKLLINFVWKFLATVRFGNNHVAAILGFGDLQWGNILITRVYFVEGLGHNLFSVGQFCDSDLEVAFRRNTCFIRNLEGVDLLKGNHTTNLYTINLHDMASAYPICLIGRATSTKSWLWHQRLSHLNFDIINDLARNDLVTGLPKFKYHKEHLCPSCKQGKGKRASHPPKPAEAIAIACYTQNHSIIYRRFDKTPYELINGRKPDISFFMYSGLSVIPRMIVKILGSFVQKVILAFSLVTPLIPVLTEFTTQGQRKSWRP